MKLLQDPKFRKWVYGVLASVLALLGAYGIINSGEASSWLELADSLLNIGAAAAFSLAASKTSPQPYDKVGESPTQQ